MRRKLNLMTVVMLLLLLAVLFARAKGIPVHDFRVGFSSGG
jgi:hypothetical protein